MDASNTKRSHDELHALYVENAKAGRAGFAGFTSDEIAAWNRRVMFGDNDEAFPSPEEWSRIVD
ncbi:MAG: hypothetical protein ACHREM_00930 [Polyangiales bacterium]